MAYLAVIGSTAGFMFGTGTSPDTRKFLMLFGVTVSVMSLFAWFAGLKWVKEFSAAMERISPPGSPPLALAPFRTDTWLGIGGAAIITVGIVLLYFKA